MSFCTKKLPCSLVTWLNLSWCSSPASWRLPLTKTRMPPGKDGVGWQSTVQTACRHCSKGSAASFRPISSAPATMWPSKESMEVWP
uniref:Uncharacterized protein n=1 Tax=Oryza brachyantha TaxID=4533 RepID=J3L4T1_ORYBR